MFRNDYSEIGAPEVLGALMEYAAEQNPGYGTDRHTENARKLILRQFGLSENDSDVHFLAGGTQTNLCVISYYLRPYEGVIACDTGHINVHETGAVEASGHKVVTFRNQDGKLLPSDIEKAMALHRDEHMVKLRMVYISDSTETGTVYTAAELYALREVCDRYGLLLFMDGARLGVALTAPGGDVSCETIGRVCDVFYVGGTKNGALAGEAVVFKRKQEASEFRYHIKNRGAMTAKGFVTGIQFERLFSDGLYFRLAENSNRTAEALRRGLTEAGIPLVGNAASNQIFLRVKRDFAGILSERYGAELWEDGEQEQVIRLVTSFATKMTDCTELISFIKSHH